MPKGPSDYGEVFVGDSCGRIGSWNWLPLRLAYSGICRLRRTRVEVLADGFTGLGNLAKGEDMHHAFNVIPQNALPVLERTSLGLRAASF